MGHNNVFVYRLNEDNYTDLSFLKDKTFSIIICQSVIQYYKDVSEVERLIKRSYGESPYLAQDFLLLIFQLPLV